MSASVSSSVGTASTPGVGTSDSAAAFMDNDLFEGNGSLHAERKLEKVPDDIIFLGSEASPMRNDVVTVVTMNIPHAFKARVIDVGVPADVKMSCTGGLTVPLERQMVLDATGFTNCFTQGDSGSIVLNSSQEVVGMMNWVLTSNQCIGGGTSAAFVRERMGFDNWYGTLTSGFDLKCN